MELRQSLLIAQLYDFAARSLAQVHDISVRPQLRFKSSGDAVAAEGGLPAVHVPVVDGSVLTGDHGTDAPQVTPRDAVHVVHPQLQMLARTAVITELGGRVPVSFIEEERVFRIVYRGVKLHLVDEGLRVLLYRLVGRLQLILHAIHQYIVVYVELYEIRMSEGCRYGIFAHHFPGDGRCGVGAGRQLQRSCAVVYLQFHSIDVLMTFKRWAKPPET